MGLIGNVLAALFGGGRSVVAETAQVFRVNAEAADQRSASAQSAALRQLAREYGNSGLFNQIIDALNRLPRPALALGTIALFVAAMVDPVWFAERMQGLVLVPDQLWTLLGIIVAFYFGARELSHFRAQGMRKAAADAAAAVPAAVENIERLRELRHDSPGVADTGADADLTLSALSTSNNAALDDWRRDNA